MCQCPGVVGGHWKWPWCALVRYGGLPAVGWAGRICVAEGRLWPLSVPVGHLAATEVANRPTASPAEAACALGVVWGHVLWL